MSYNLLYGLASSSQSTDDKMSYNPFAGPAYNSIPLDGTSYNQITSLIGLSPSSAIYDSSSIPPEGLPNNPFGLVFNSNPFQSDLSANPGVVNWI